MSKSSRSENSGDHSFFLVHMIQHGFTYVLVTYIMYFIVIHIGSSAAFKGFNLKMIVTLADAKLACCTNPTVGMPCTAHEAV